MCRAKWTVLFGARDLELAPLSFYPQLNTVYFVLNLIDYLRFKIPKVGLGKLFEMFGPSLQVTYYIICSHVGRIKQRNLSRKKRTICAVLVTTSINGAVKESNTESR